MTTTIAERLGAGRYIDTAVEPAGTSTSTHELTTTDGAKVNGVLRVVPGAETVVCLMHPRQDFTHHVMVPELLSRGYAVWTQSTRSPNNDLSLIHEQAVLDMAAGQVFLRERGFQHVVTLGHSGGGTLSALYHQQAGLAPADRIRATPTGRPIDFGTAQLPLPDGAIFLAPHPGQGALLQRLIDPSVVDEADPMSIDPVLDPYDPANGFATAPEWSKYSAEFVARYRAAQARRIQRIDSLALEAAAAATASRRDFKHSADVRDRRRSLAPHIVTVYRTDADLRSVDRTLDLNERPYGSLFGRRPDLTNYGLVGFGRLSTPEAWLSTWSVNTTNADFLTCAPGVKGPALLIGLSGDQACFAADIEAMTTALGSSDITTTTVRGTHFGGPIGPGEPPGSSLAAARIGGWLADRYPTGEVTA